MNELIDLRPVRGDYIAWWVAWKETSATSQTVLAEPSDA